MGEYSIFELYLSRFSKYLYLFCTLKSLNMGENASLKCQMPESEFNALVYPWFWRVGVCFPTLKCSEHQSVHKSRAKTQKSSVKSNPTSRFAFQAENVSNQA